MNRVLAFTAAVLFITPISACAAQAPGGVIRALGDSWGGGSTPKCEKSTANEMVDGQLNPLYCEWSSDTEAPNGRVRAWLDESGRPSVVIREQVFATSHEATRFADSLDASFAARGLHRHSCGEANVPAGSARNTLWTSTRLAVYLSHVRSESGPSQILIFAVDDPSHLPAIYACHLRGIRPA